MRMKVLMKIYKVSETIDPGTLDPDKNNVAIGLLPECLVLQLPLPISVLINVSANAKFTTGKGLTQGDPLSPFLFLIVSEALNLSLQTGNEQGYLGGFSMSQNGVHISHLQFADDTLVFLDDSIEQMNFLRFYMLGFEMLSGLHIKFQSAAFLVWREVNLAPMARMLGSIQRFCLLRTLVSHWETPYWALRSGKVSLTESLPSWKRSSLSKAGKLTLIKSVLLSIPIHMLSLFIAPPKVVKAIEKVIRDFLWDAADTKKGYHYVKWKTCCLPLKAGG
ncbi:uncharacterized protein LOC113352536 [Papaver somniferum]|uniref:uncharacterized protein LOC113352536 n=1 Tax=Papaver somniferum TaxID=3469 RepID=UPI000E6FF993|nr:uncharacterized protein LOC113352536 [Papaver somniferum]